MFAHKYCWLLKIIKLLKIFSWSCLLGTFQWPDNTWIKANHKQFGYYRVNYERDNWERLSEVLKNNMTVTICYILMLRTKSYRISYL